MHSMQPTTAKSSGFTLVEMLVVAPMIVLMIAALIATMINMVGEVMMSRERGQLVATTQDALDRIEADVRLTGQFATTTGAVASPQGSNNVTAAFTNASNRLVLTTFLTTINPVDRFGALDLVYKANTPNTCSDPDPTKSYTYNEPLLGYIVYFTSGNALYRRTIVPTYAPGTCGTAWQRNSCIESNVGTGRCVTRDEKVLDNLSGVSVKYFFRPGDTAQVTAGNSPTARTVEVTLSAEKTVSGSTISHSATLRATRLNSPVKS